MKFLQHKSTLIRALAVLALSVGSVGAQANTPYAYSGVITSCTGVCSVFTAVGQTADFSFDSAATGPGSIGAGDISNVDISLSTPSGGALAFVSGFAVESALTINGADNVTGGDVTLQATGATTGIVARAVIDVASGTWTAFVVPVSGPLEQIASGTGAFAAVGAYAQNFELLASDANLGPTIPPNPPFEPDEIPGEGFQVFADVWDGEVGGNGFQYNYGVFPAPNGTAGFSSIAGGEGGEDQGLQYLTIYSDYDNLDHGNGLTINTSVFRERTLTADDIDGSTWTLTSDYKAPFSGGVADEFNCGLDTICGGANAADDTPNESTARAYITTLDPNNGFARTNYIEFDTTSASNADWAGFSISIELSDPALEGQVLQFGFNTTASDYDPSGVFYDNICFDNTGGCPVAPPVSGKTGNDFDNDGDSDVLLRNTSTGQWRRFDMQSGLAALSGNPLLWTGSAYDFQAIGDFDGDGDADVLVRNSSSGAWWQFTLEAGVVVGGANPLIWSGSAWEFRAVGDFDGDGDDDVLLRNTSTGQWRRFDMQSGVAVSSGNPLLWSGPAYEFQTVGDFDGDGDADVMVRNPSTGAWWQFTIESGVVSGGGNPLLWSGLSWEFRAAADFDGNGVDDMLLRNSSGQWRRFDMQNGAAASSGNPLLWTGPTYTFQMTGDFDGDGDADVLVRDLSAGAWYGFTIESGAVVGGANPLLWSGLFWEIRAN